ncbi:unnamed protein product [Caenorhabditis auriculariae]|uniref:BZIP domain-containing protein n=1 Tax=Caenorhabditis auriculariae TaxID=2777116 RepID=A0A8S1HF45_9PELO|nr:unnamed protein product [Caenorhabditis auriculariae]
MLYKRRNKRMSPGASRLYELQPDPYDYSQRRSVRLCLFNNVKNAEQLREALAKGDIDAALIRAELVLEPFILLAAANRAVHQAAHNRMTCRNLVAELVYSLSPSRNISDSLVTFGIAEQSKAIIAAIFDDKDGSKMKKLAKKIEGNIESLDNLPNIANFPIIKQIYQIGNPNFPEESVVDHIVSRLSPFDADDFMRRGLFGSLMGFRRSSAKSETVTHQQAASSQPQNSVRAARVAPPLRCSEPKFVVPAIVTEPSPPLPTPIRSKYDIYREIVTEAEQLERSNTATPISEFASCPTSPTTQPYVELLAATTMSSPPPPAPLTPGLNSAPPPQFGLESSSSYGFPMSPLSHQNAHPDPKLLDYMMGSQCGSGMPPPYYMPAVSFDGAPPYVLLDPNMALNGAVKQEVLDKYATQSQAISIEEIVKLVVSAMRTGEEKEENPEEVLRKKRNQNNLAAARYRQRQKEARKVAHEEVVLLKKRNGDLKATIECLEREISHLKALVLTPSAVAAVQQHTFN